MWARVLLVLAVGVLASCGDAPPRDQDGDTPRILAMGDSMLAWNAPANASVADALSRELNLPVTDRSVSGAQIIYGLPISGAFGLNISQQYISGRWDWVVLNGGGNDLWLGCGCSGCASRLNRMISEDGQRGAIPDLVRRLTDAGAQVLYVGYLRTPGRGSPIDHCARDGDILEDRLTRMAQQHRNTDFVSLRGLVPYGDLSFHGPDRIHPSQKGSAAIARRIADTIRPQL